MEPYVFKKIIPDDVFITIEDREPTEEELWMGVSPVCRGNRSTGYEVMDVFAALIRQLGFSDDEVYAARMGLTAEELRTIVLGLSGMSFNKWRNCYLVRMAAELLRDQGLYVSEVASRLGFTSSAVFSRCFSKHTGRQPYEFLSYYRFKRSFKYRRL